MKLLTIGGNACSMKDVLLVTVVTFSMLVSFGFILVPGQQQEKPRPPTLRTKGDAQQTQQPPSLRTIVDTHDSLKTVSPLQAREQWDSHSFHSRAVSDQVIRDLWERKVKKDSKYLEKHKTNFIETVERSGIDWQSMDVPRLFIYMDWVEWSNKYNLRNPKRFLTTFEADPENTLVTATQTDTYIHNETTGGGDLHDMSSLEDDVYDLVIFSQTLEHLYNPFLAMHQIFKKVAPGGYVFTSCPTLNMQHMTPFHFFHYTPMGLAILMFQAGFEIIETGQYGSFDYEQLVLKHRYWPNYEKLVKSGSIENNADNPDQVWILVRKPGGEDLNPTLGPET